MSKGKYAYSLDDEIFNGAYDTASEAASEAFASSDQDVIWVSVMNTPIPPEELIEADDLIEIVINCEEYHGDHAEHWPVASKEQRAELTSAVRKVFAAWLDKHDMRPDWFNCDDAEEYERPIDYWEEQEKIRLE